MAHDWDSLIWAESAELAMLYNGISDADFDHATLCEGWKVRDVAGHMLVGHTTPMPKMLGMLMKYRFNVPRGSFELSKAYAADHTPAQLRAAWSDVAKNRTRKGITKVISNKPRPRKKMKQ